MTTPSSPPAGPEPTQRPGPARVPRPLQIAADWSWRLLVVGVAVAIVLLALSRLQVVVLPVIGALLLCTFLAPLVGFLDNRGMHRGVATALVSVGAVGALAGLVAAFTFQVRDSIEELTEGTREGIRQIEDWLVGGPADLERSQIREAADAAIEQLTSPDALLQSGLLARAATAVEVLGGLALAVVLVFFFLKDGDSMWRWMVRRLGVNAGPHVDAAGRRAWEGLGGFMRGQAIVAAADAIFIGLGIWLLGVPLAVPLATLIFFAAFFPIVGAVLAGSAAVLVALATEGFLTAVLLLAIVIAVQQIEGNVLQPVVMARTARLHAVVVLLALAVGAALGGIVGAFLAVPIAAAAAAAGGYAWTQMGPAPAPADDPPVDSS
ncbi:MAG: AI-2E family transporter [Miltoncostaeaceae bacterium]